MEYTIPEKVGISSENILKLIKSYNEAGLNMHDVLILRHGKICFECYWKPFHKDFPHRMYSITKSFVAIAVGFLEQDGLVNLDDRILKYFPEEEELSWNDGIKQQTIRDMLMMATARGDEFWFTKRPMDRVKYYFETEPEKSKTPGTLYRYDSNGSFILGAMVERITKKSLLEYMQSKVFDKIGMSRNIECLTCPGGHSWGDSAFIMPAEDLLKFAMFVMNKGKYQGEQILNEKFMSDAVTKQIDNNFVGNNTFNNQGYGYQIWRTYDNSYGFFGMGSQYAICVPDKDLIFVCNADNQGIDYAGKFIFDEFFDLIARTATETKLAENSELYNQLLMYTDKLELSVAHGEVSSSYEKVIDGKRIYLDKNPMGIEWFELKFTKDGGAFCYKNQQGEKTIKFGRCQNIFGMFPQTGYANQCATVSEEGHMYECAASAAWIEQRKLYIKVQVIDKYFGNLHIVVSFNKEGKAGLSMQKFAEDFMEEYDGYAAEK